MSTPGINFLDRWISNNVPEATKADVISIDELTHELLADADAVGIMRIDRTILDAIVHYDAGVPE